MSKTAEELKNEAAEKARELEQKVKDGASKKDIDNHMSKLRSLTSAAERAKRGMNN